MAQQLRALTVCGIWMKENGSHRTDVSSQLLLERCTFLPATMLPSMMAMDASPSGTIAPIKCSLWAREQLLQLFARLRSIQGKHPNSVLPPRAPMEGATPELFHPIPWATSVE
ncbi:hypothetical protein LEMLEM_LOCUS18641 [Lemmus lemmus]